MTAHATYEQDRDDARSAILALVEDALALADEHGFIRAGIYISHAREVLREKDAQPSRKA